MMIRFRFELERLRSNRKICIIAGVFFIFSLVYIYLGKTQYDLSHKEKKNFTNSEEFGIQMYKNYDQYGSLGFRLLFEKSPLCMLYDYSYFSTGKYTNIDTIEKTRTVDSKNRKTDYAPDKVYINGFFDLTWFFGSFILLYLGVTTFNGLNNLELYRDARSILASIFYRGMPAVIYFVVLFAAAYLELWCFGFPLTGAALKGYIHYAVYSIFALMGFFGAGALIDLLTFHSRKTGLKYLYISVAWILFLIVIPQVSATYNLQQTEKIQSIEVFNHNKFICVMDFQIEAEKRFYEKMKEKNADMMVIAREIINEYLTKTYPENKKKDLEYLNKEIEVMRGEESRSMWCPTIFQHFLGREIAGCGHYAELLFHEYILELRERFIFYCLHKRYFSDDKVVENFIKGDENVFKAPSMVPPSFGKALGILFFYLAVLAGCLAARAFFLVRRSKTDRPAWDLDKNTFYYKCFKTEEERNDFFRAFVFAPGVSTLDRVDFTDIEPAFKPGLLLEYWCLSRGVPLKQVKKNLVVLGMEKVWEWDRQRLDIDPVLPLKIYVALVLAEENDLVIINDFIKNRDRDFDEKFRELLEMKVNNGKTMVYLSTLMPYSIVREMVFEDALRVEYVEANPVDVCFR